MSSIIMFTVCLLYLAVSLVRPCSTIFLVPPEAEMTVVELITYHGYPVQVFHAYTADGYILQLHRIPFGKNGSFLTLHFESSDNSSNQKRAVVFLQHGLLGSSADWVTNLPNQSLAFILADAGFDVWLGNSRGNTYSNRHVKYSTDETEYWKFSWDDMARYDLDAVFDLVLNKTKQTGLYYVGHSQGTLIMFAKLAQDPNFAPKVRKFFALAPVATVGHIKGMISFLATKLFRYKIAQLVFGSKYFMVNDKISKAFSILLCGFHYLNPLCNNVLFQIAGPESNQFNETRLLVYLMHTPAGTSTMNIFHWIQMVNSGKMQAYDYESKKRNREHYGQDSAPVYNISSINVPTYVYWSDTDWLADSLDVQNSLLSVLPNTTMKVRNKLKDFNHLDFIWGLRASTEIYQPMVSIIKGCEHRRTVF